MSFEEQKMELKPAFFYRALSSLVDSGMFVDDSVGEQSVAARKTAGDHH